MCIFTAPFRYVEVDASAFAGEMTHNETSQAFLARSHLSDRVAQNVAGFGLNAGAASGCGLFVALF